MNINAVKYALDRAIKNAAEKAVRGQLFRNRKLSCADVIYLLIGVESGSLAKELHRADIDAREDVIALLKMYPKLQRKVRLLEYERLHPPKVSQNEVINGLALSHPLDGGTSSAGHISDKTMQIALNFQDETDRLNYATVLEIDQELHILKNRIAKLEFYVEQLDKKQADVIRKYYFEEKTWPEIQKEMHISSRTLSKYRGRRP